MSAGLAVLPTYADTWVFDDGGREAAGFRGRTGDCGVRAIAIAALLDYRDVYEALFELNRKHATKRDDPARLSPRNGTNPKAMRELLASLGWAWTPTMRIGSGCTVHLHADELPAGRLVVRCSRHIVAVIDGVIHDTHDPSRDGTRCVYGYWSAP